MSPTDHERVAALFRACRGLEPGERDALLAAECADDAELRAEVLALLEHDESDVLEVAGAALADGLRQLEPGLPERVGRYRILGLLGAGGMGVVYEAEQERPRRRVALKVIRPGFATPELVRRFEHEAEVLGWLDHPGIARIYDAGTAATELGVQPYFAMELVEGRSLVRYAEAEGLDAPARLALLARVAEAVHHAHQKGVVHRDLKPSNVLVDATGQPKVLDFGVARVTNADLQAGTLLTRAGELVGTLPYMSPEQVAGDPASVDARSDVYSLGALGYELLSGELPHDVRSVSLPEAARRITEDEPTALGALRRSLRGDVEVIVGKALASDKERRFASAEELARDLRRHLANEVIHARPPSGIYQLRKFARRNRGLVSALGLVAASLMVGAVVSFAQYRDAQAGWEAEREQRARAEERLVEADRVTEFLVGLFEVPDPSDDWGAEVTARELLDRGAASITAELSDQPRVASRLQRTMGRVFRNLGDLERAVPLLDAALASARELGAGVAESLHARGMLASSRANHAAAEAYLDEALAVARAEHGPHHPLVATLHGDRAVPRFERGDYAGALADVDQALALWAEHAPNEPLSATNALMNRAQILFKAGELEAAEAALREVLELREAHLAEDHPDTVKARSALALMRLRAGAFEDALALLEDVHATRAAHLGPLHPSVLDARNDLGVTLHSMGRLDEALEHHTASLAGRRERFGPDSPHTAIALHNLAAVEEALGRFDDAEEHYRAALALRLRTLGPEHMDVLSTRLALGSMLSSGPRRPDLALPELEAAFDILRALEAAGRGAEVDPEAVLRAQLFLANARLGAGDFERGAEELEALLARYTALGRQEGIAQTLNSLSIVHFQLGDVERALGYAERCGAVQDALLAEGHPDRAYNLDMLGRIQLELGRIADARATLTKSLAIRTPVLPATHPLLAETRVLLGRALAASGEPEAAEPHFLAALAIVEGAYPPGHPQLQNLYATVAEFYGGWGRPSEAEAYRAKLADGR